MSFAWLLPLLGTCLVLCSNVTFAESGAEPGIRRQRIQQDGATYDIVTRQEGRKWIREVFVEDAEGWPHLIQRKESRFEQRILAVRWKNQIPPRIVNDQKYPMWESREAWSLEWERKFSEWVAASVGTDFFEKHQIATDCADAEFALRWIFARMHRLPMANRMGANDRLLTNETAHSLWGSYPTSENWWEDQRFRVALDYVLSNTFTHSLMGDSHPIALRVDSVTPGAFFLNLFAESGHTQIIHRTYYGQAGEIPFRVMQSTVPRAVRVLMEGLPFGDLPKKGQSGLLRMNWAIRTEAGELSLLPPEKHPDYSEEQYSSDWTGGSSSFLLAIFKKLDPSFQLASVAQSLSVEIQKQIEMRKSVVRDGFEACLKESCEPGSAGYEAWSTPSRDGRLKSKYSLIWDLQYLASGTSQEEEAKRIQDIRNEMLNSWVEIEGERFQVRHVFWALQRGLASFDPRHPVSERWGLTPQGLSGAFARRFEESIRARALKIVAEKSECPTEQSCPPGSDGFQKWNTLKEDWVIGEPLPILVLRNSSYCQAFDATRCAELARKLAAQRYFFDGRNLSLEELLPRILLMRSSPGVADEGRWGRSVPGNILLGDAMTEDSAGTSSSMIPFSELPAFLASDESEWVGQQGRDWVYHRPSGKRVYFVDWKLTALRGELALFLQGNRAQWVRSGKSIATLEFPGTIQSARVISPNRVVLLSSDGAVSLLHEENGTWVTEKEWRFSQPVVFPENTRPFLITRNERGAHGLFFHEEGVTELLQESDQSGETVSDSVYCVEKVCHWGTVRQNGAFPPSVGGILFELPSGRILRKGGVVFLREVRGNWYVGLNENQQATIELFDPKSGRFTPVMVLPPSLVLDMMDDVLIHVSIDGRVSYLRLNGAESERLDLGSLGNGIQVTPRFIVAQKENFSTLYSRSDMRKFREGPAWRVLQDSGRGSAYLNEYFLGSDFGYSILSRIDGLGVTPLLEGAELQAVLGDGSLILTRGMVPMIFAPSH